MKLNFIKIKFMLLGAASVLLLGGCLKKTDSAAIPGEPIKFSGDNLVATLGKETSLKLFNQAFLKAGLDKNVTADKGFTIFALTDSAMTAAGLDAAAITRLQADSLRKLIGYQIISGAYDDAALSKGSVAQQLFTLKIDTIKKNSGGVSLSAAYIFIKLQGSFYFNGVGKAQSKAGIKAINGSIHIMPGLAPALPASGTLMDVIDNDPDLSMYRMALSIQDSVHIAAVGYDDGSSDTGLFGRTPDAYHQGMMPTVLAPTNKAFHDAGFNTYDDLAAFATRYYTGLDQTNYVTFNYSSIDSVLRHHVIFNIDISTGNTGMIRVFYNDFLTPDINNGFYNNYIGGGSYQPAYLNYPVPLIFSSMNGLAQVKWTKDVSQPLVTIPKDASAAHPVNNHVAANGTLYKIDKLFYPIAK